MRMPTAAFDSEDRKTDRVTAGLDSSVIGTVMNKRAAVATGRTSELADINGVYNIIVNFLRNSIAIFAKYGYHVIVSSTSAEMRCCMVQGRNQALVGEVSALVLLLRKGMIAEKIPGGNQSDEKNVRFTVTGISINVL